MKCLSGQLWTTCRTFIIQRWRHSAILLLDTLSAPMSAYEVIFLSKSFKSNGSLLGRWPDQDVASRVPISKGSRRNWFPSMKQPLPECWAPRWLTGACGKSGHTADRPAPRWVCTQWAWISPHLRSALGRRASHSDLGASWEWCTLERKTETKSFTRAAYVAAGEAMGTKTQGSHSATYVAQVWANHPSPQARSHLGKSESVTYLAALVIIHGVGPVLSILH